MAYKLTLEASERKAIDWIGDRYATGSATRRVLFEAMPPDAQWDSRHPITFTVRESDAWTLSDLWQEDDLSFPCFAPALVEKLLEFWNAIV